MSESDLCCFSLLNRFQTLVRLWRRLGAEPGGAGKGGRGAVGRRPGLGVNGCRPGPCSSPGRGAHGLQKPSEVSGDSIS